MKKRSVPKIPIVKKKIHIVKKIIGWISLMLSEGDGTPSTKRVCFFSSTLACIIFIAALLCSKNAALAVDLSKWLLTTAGAAYGITRFAEYGTVLAPPTVVTPPQSVAPQPPQSE